MLSRLWLAGKTVTNKWRTSEPSALMERGEHARAALDWLCRAQDATPDGGVSASYHLRDGWLPSYPETTGYIADTFFDLLGNPPRDDLKTRVDRMIAWLLEQQCECGGFPGQFGARSCGPIVFNTGQIIFGLVRAAEHDPGYTAASDAAHRAARWLASMMDVDGCWRRHTHGGVPHSYNTRTSWALLRCHALAGDATLKRAAEHNLRWTLRQQANDGFLMHAGFDALRPPYLHTIAYALRGLLECGVLLGDEVAISRARLGAEALREALDRNGRLAGAYRDKWRPAASYRCLTGEAQTAILWARLYEMGGPDSYRDGCRQLVDAVAATQSLHGSDHIRGAIAGSDPIWGRYARFEFPNWAAKFFIDAVGALERIAPAPSVPAEEVSCASPC